MENLVQINNLFYCRGNRTIFNNINISIKKNSITAIMGPSGSGKTTLLKLIGGLLKPNAGEIVVKGNNIPSLTAENLFKARQKMGLLFQSSALFTDLNVYDNIAFPLRENTNLSEGLIRAIVMMKLESVGLRGTAEMMPANLSGGMTRRVALARAMTLDPELMMYDEPFTGQDPVSMGVLVRLIKKFNSFLNLTSIIVSHDIIETASIADYIYIIGNGKIVGDGTPEELKKSTVPNVMQFMQGQVDGVVPFHYPANSYEESLLNV